MRHDKHWSCASCVSSAAARRSSEHGAGSLVSQVLWAGYAPLSLPQMQGIAYTESLLARSQERRSTLPLSEFISTQFRFVEAVAFHLLMGKSKVARVLHWNKEY